MRWVAAVGLIGAGLALAGCGSGTVSGTADPEAVASGEPAFSPCDDIPDDVVRAQYVDLSTEERDIMGVKQPGWNVCGWSGPRYSLTVYATNKTMDDVRSNGKNEDFAPVELGDRAGVTYREIADTDRESCDVAMVSGAGTVLVSVGFHVLTPPRDVQEPCEIAIQSARALVPHIPQ